DVGRVCILQGPVAVRYSTKANEPVKDILDGIYHGQIAKLLERLHGGEQDRISSVEYLGGGLALSDRSLAEPAEAELPATEIHVLAVPKDLSEVPEDHSWFETLAGRERSWLRALLTSRVVMQGSRLVDNVVRQALRPQPGQVARVKSRSDGQPLKVEIIDMAGQREAMLAIDGKGLIKFFLFTTARRRQCALEIQLMYSPQTGAYPIHEVIDGHVERIKRFYAQLWFEDTSLAESAIGSAALVHRGPETIPSQADVDAFRAAIGAARGAKCADVPLDYSIKVFWPALCACLMSATCDGDLSRLVHVSNAFSRVKGQGIRIGARLGSEACVTEAVDGPTGRLVGVCGYVLADGVPAVEVRTKFLFRRAGKASSSASQFRVVDEPDTELHIGDRTMLARILSKSWFVPAETTSRDTPSGHGYKHIHVGSTLLFRL
ncbi:hypothetical protein LPJ75_006164, partial [Coemansia sp. RSA 2598]